MIRILFNGHDFKFLQPLIAHYQSKSSYQVTLDHTGGHHIFDKPNSLKLLGNADVIFCEWALGNAVWYSANKLDGQKLIIRLHHQEINLKFLDEISWENVDRIVFICPENMEIFLRRFPKMVSRTVLIYNLIDCGSFSLEKKPGANFNLGFIGTSPMRKAPHLALALFERMKELDDRYTLYFKGKHPWEYPWLWEREEERHYFEALYDRIRSSGLSSSILFDPHGNDMPEWFSKIGIILSTSDHEGSHQAVAEGMAAGCLPVIRNWAGAEKLYPPRFVVRNLTEAVDMVRNWLTGGQLFQLEQEVRQFARENFDLPVVTDQYDRLISELTSTGDASAKSQTKAAEQDHLTRVAFVCYLTPGKQSGYEVRVLEEASLLSRQGVIPWIVIFISAEKNPPVEQLDWYIREMEQKTGARVKVIPTDHFFHLHDSDALFRTVDDPLTGFIREERINILHAEALYAAHHCRRVADKTRCRLVFDNHGALPEETRMRGGNLQWISRLEEVEQQLLTSSDMTVLVSSGMKNFYAQRYNLNLGDPQILPCCVHSKSFVLDDEQRSQARAEKGFSNRFVLLYLGTLSIWQWPAAMFGLFARIHREFPDTFLYMLIPEYDHPVAHEYLKKYQITDGNYLLEEVPHHMAGQRIGLADAGFLLREEHPVNRVSSPTKFGEYLAAGIPVILTEGIGDYSEMADIMNVGLTLKLETEVVSPVEFDRLKSFISDVQQNRAHWAARCRQVAHQQLDWDVFGDALIRRYNQLIDNNF